MQVPDHQRLKAFAAEEVRANQQRSATIFREHVVDTLDLDQLAAILARMLEL